MSDYTVCVTNDSLPVEDEQTQELLVEIRDLLKQILVALNSGSDCR